MRKYCIICGKAITERFFVCQSCVKKYNIPFKYRDWPLWLKALHNIEHKNLKLMREEEDLISTDDLYD